MVIKANNAPLAVLLTIQAFDIDGLPIPRLVYLDTTAMQGKTLVIEGTQTTFKSVRVLRFCFLSPSLAVSELLRNFLPEELHSHVVVDDAKGQK